MKTLYLECNMGAAGDMLTAALYELLDETQKAAFLQKMNDLFPDVQVTPEASEKCGICGTHMSVSIRGEEEISEDVGEHEHHHHDHDEEGHEHHHHHDHDEEGHEHHHHHDHDEEGHEHHHHHTHDEEGHEHHHHHDHDEEGHEHHHHHDHDEEGHEHHHHHHTAMADIASLIGNLDLPEKVRDNAKAVYGLIAAAESEVHGRPVTEIHFHEVGTMDAVADVVGVCLILDMLHADQIVASPVHTGSGFVRCMHGVLPVPAPATALLLKNIPSYATDIRGELCTPTGAALLHHFVKSFGPMPIMATEKIGYGLGKKDFPRANMLRAFLGETGESGDVITKLECNLDDMTGEEIGFAEDMLFQAGARDVFTQSIGMKKNRPGVLLSVICSPEQADEMAALMLRYTTTLGIRRADMTRYVLARESGTLETPYGAVQTKRSYGYGTEKCKIEYDDAARIAKEKQISLREARELLERT